MCGYNMSNFISSEITSRGITCDPFNITVPENHKALNVWCSPKHYIFFVTFEKNDGNKVTKKISASNATPCGTSEAEYNKWMDLELPVNKYFTHISTEKDLAIGIDQDQNLWVFGVFTKNFDDAQRTQELFEGYDPT